MKTSGGGGVDNRKSLCKLQPGTQDNCLNPFIHAEPGLLLYLQVLDPRIPWQ